jgi:hypothetical protein
VEQGALRLTEEKRENVAILNSGKNNLNEPTSSGVLPSMSVLIPQAHTPEEKEHSEHSPSSLKEKAKCPGFRNDQTRDKTAANRGNLGHLATEKENLDMIPPDDPKLREAVEMCLRYLSALRKPLVNARELREQRYNMLDQFGHVDHIILHGDKGELVDYKFAFGEYVADSPQFWAYAVGLWDAHPEVEQLTVHVLLPFRGVIDRETWTRGEDYDRLSAQTAAIIAAARRDDASTYLTGAHCAWCARQASCPKLSSLALTIASEYKADELTLPAQYDPANISDPHVIAFAKKAAPIMRSWADKVDARALEMRMQEGIEIPGFELAERKSPFKITNAQAAWETVKDKITPEAFAACAEVKIGELEKAIARTAKRGEMARSKEQLRDALVDADAAKSEGTYHYLKKSK